MAGDASEVSSHQTKSKKSGSKRGLVEQSVKNEEVSLEQCRQILCEKFPGRKDEIEELVSLLGEPVDTFPPLLLYGGPATGKTSVIRETMAVLRRPFAYVSCRSCYNQRLVFESVLNQLTGHVRCKANSYSSFMKCERVSDFVSSLVEVVSTTVFAQTRNDNSSSTEINDRAGQVVYLIFDDVELIRGWIGGDTLMPALVTLSGLTRLPNLGLVFVGNAGPDTFQLGNSSREPLSLYFRDYTEDELFSILVRWKPASELYSFFLKASLPSFSRRSRILTELSEGLHPLFEKYCEAVRQGKVKPKGEGRRELFTFLRNHMQPALSQTFFIIDSDSNGQGVKEDKAGSLDKAPSTSRVEFHLSLCSKYLLLASYIASRNPSTLDDALFDTGDATKSKRRKRKSSMSAMEKKDAEIQEKHLKGPSYCALERLLAIYRCIAVDSSSMSDGARSCHFLFGEEEEGDNGYGVTADVLMQLTTLTNVKLLLRSSSSPLEGFPKFCSNVDKDFIVKVAKSIDFPLSKYLLHG